MPNYHTVLFDADNTLFDFDRAEREALRRALTERGYPFTPETEECYLSINRALWHRFDLGEVTQDWLLVERFRRFEAAMGGQHDPEQFNRDYLSYLGQGAFLLPGAEALCRALAPRCTLAIITNGATAAQRGRFERCAVRDCFSHLFISQELGCRKPERAYFDKVFAGMGLSGPEGVVVVGDNLLSDIRGGMDAGTDTIWYNPAGAAAPDDIRPTYTVSAFPEIARIILGDEPVPHSKTEN